MKVGGTGWFWNEPNLYQMGKKNFVKKTWKMQNTILGVLKRKKSKTLLLMPWFSRHSCCWLFILISLSELLLIQCTWNTQHLPYSWYHVQRSREGACRILDSAVAWCGESVSDWNVVLIDLLPYTVWHSQHKRRRVSVWYDKNQE